MTKDFQSWIKKKSLLHNLPDEKIPFYSEREVWWCALGINVGFEQDGKNTHFERPVLVLRKFNKHLFLAIPQTSQPKEGRFYYGTERGGREYFLILSKIRVMSSKRLLRKIGMISEKDFDMIRTAMKSLL